MSSPYRHQTSTTRRASSNNQNGGSGYNVKKSSPTSRAGRADDFRGVPNSAIVAVCVLIGVTMFFSLGMQNERSILLFCTALCAASFVLAAKMVTFVMSKPSGTIEMMQVVDAVRQGAEGFFKTQYTTIFRMTIAMSILLFLGYLYRPINDAQSHISPSVMATVTVFCFVFGALCSSLAGYVGLYVCVRANARVAGAARRSFKDAMQISLLSGAVPAILVIALVVVGIIFLYALLTTCVIGTDQANERPSEVPLLLVGYGFGASFVALFAQLGGGIYTKAADVGADLVGKGEFDLDEDDPRNPAVVADLVGDNVGDCAGRGADLFESIAAEIVSAMILGGTMAENAKIPASSFIMFPIVIHGFDLLVSSIGVAAAYYAPSSLYRLKQPLLILKCGYFVAVAWSVVTFYIACKWLLDVPDAPQASNCFFMCGVLGMIAAVMMVLITQYYTDYTHHPVHRIAKASVSGHATNIIAGTSVGMESTALPTLVVSVALLGSYYLGDASGVVSSDGSSIGGIFGTAVATMGMLSSACFVLTMDFFGPISDNAGGIVEMGSEPEEVREVTDLLDAVGNTTKAATKGFAVGSASLACFLLFSAFMDEVSLFTGEPFEVVDIAQPEVFVGGALGATLVMVFSSWTLLAVGRSAEQLVVEVRRQFKSEPGILKGTCKPNYTQCVALANRAALKEMIRPGTLAVVAPIAIGYSFRVLGEYRGDPLLGSKAIAGMLMFATVCGVMMSLYMNNAGGAWDNAKKLVETGKYGGKNSEAHKATVTGDTVGDPFKDTAGPSLHVLIKLLSTITLVMAPLFVSTSVDSSTNGGVASGATHGDVRVPHTISQGDGPDDDGTGVIEQVVEGIVGSASWSQGDGNPANEASGGGVSLILMFVLFVLCGGIMYVAGPQLIRRFRKGRKRANKRALV